MSTNPPLRFVSLALVLAMAPLTACACRYSVRDIGFVDDDLAAPTIVVTGPVDVAERVESALRRRSEALGLKPSVAREVGSDLAVALRRNDSRFALPTHAEEPSQIADQAIGAVGPSKFDRELLRTLIANPCVVLLVGSADAPDAARAVSEGVRRAIDEAELWAKPMVGEPQVVVLDAAQAEASRVLLWSLGVEAFEEPSALVVYGRLRRMGPVLTGDRLSASGVARTIALLGKDCECDLDRGVFDGPGALHVWDDELAATAREALAFDPQHPMTELEVRQILAKKTNTNRPPPTDADVFWGYEEVDLLAAVEAMPAAREAEVPPTAAVPPAAPQPPEPRTSRESEDAFDEPSGRMEGLLVVVGVATAASAMTGWFLLRRQPH